MSLHLFVYPDARPVPPPEGASCSALPAEVGAAAEAVDAVLSDSRIETLVFWDSQLGAVPWSDVERFRASLDDAWHAGTKLTGTDAPDLLRFALPLWIYRPAPAADVVGAVNWRLDLRAAFVRAKVVRRLGGIDRGFQTLAGAARELGLRMIRRGAICRQQPYLVTRPASQIAASRADHYLLLRRQVSPKWAAYGLVRRLLETPRTAAAELRAWRATANLSPVTPAPIGALQRDLEAVRLPDGVSVSVVLPTFGRYRYLAEVLDDLRAQTIPPTQILVADGNPPGERDLELYKRYADLPIEVLWHEEQGICSGRNACLQRVTGDYVWFVDDDSRFDARNVELHLRGLVAYGADVSVGPATMRARPELTPEQRETTCTGMDCGTTLCTRAILSRVGGFDMQFNLYLAGEDNDLGIRFIRSGGLMVNNPLAKRFHYLAPVGGSRSKGSVHVFRRWSLRPRPVQSVYYLARRYFEPSAAFDAMLHASMTVGWRRRGGGMATDRFWKLRTLGAEILAGPLTALRFYRSMKIGRQMVRSGPHVPSLVGPERLAETVRGVVSDG